MATSQIVSGTGKPAEDAVLDGIVYPTEAWGVRGVDGLPSQANAAARVDTAKGPAARLFAFGYDAWLLQSFQETRSAENERRLQIEKSIRQKFHAELFSRFAALGLEADEVVSRKPGWIRNNDRLRKQNVAHEAADCNMMLSVFMESYAHISPDDALREKMALKLGCKTEDLDKVLGVQQG